VVISSWALVLLLAFGLLPGFRMLLVGFDGMWDWDSLVAPAPRGR